MQQEKFETKMMEYLAGELDQEGRAEFERVLKDYPEYKDEFDSLCHAWERMDETTVPEPSERMNESFFEMLHAKTQKDKAKPKDLWKGVRSLYYFLWRPQLAYGMLLLTIGLGVGYFLNPGKTDDSVRTVAVSDAETVEVREQLVLTLLEQSSANKRLQGVNEVNKIQKADEKVIKALLQTLNKDANVNVRLAAIEALINYVENPMVREGLIQSIVHQESPIVQITLADLMVALQEKKSVESFKTLMRTKELDSSVKQKLENSIDQII
ncbi:HEAT repeat domain-containing protein [Flavobacteriaceae bacterium TP-CH-4]|uniref:HEAT repeat domain-containing protein n=1 Tax=Pelagihabitans pacificus TaxID=2696054 RepID=A0A967E4I0_9FLAO|nr:HEAT repeat domain-containing protein [Pelagihabitans pacificus]NHF58412.1 HEAT repeat domain-containing protein [Pelagihabitans pacificus]